MIGIPVALLVFNAGEWATHKFLLHGLGRGPTAFHHQLGQAQLRRNRGAPEADRSPQRSLPIGASDSNSGRWVRELRRGSDVERRPSS